jgi:ribosomal protein L14
MNMPLKKLVVRAIVVHTCKELKHKNGMNVPFNDNVAIFINQEGNLKRFRVFGPDIQKLQESDLTKIVSLVPKVL